MMGPYGKYYQPRIGDIKGYEEESGEEEESEEEEEESKYWRYFCKFFFILDKIL